MPELLTMKTNPSSRISGFSLIELMISIAVGLLLLTAIATIFANSSRSQREVALSAEQIENGRYAMDVLSEDLHHAGYWGLYSTTFTAPGAMPDPCDISAASLATAMALPVQGYNAPIATLPSCLSSANYLAGTDILVIRHASTSVAGALTAAAMYVQTQPVGTPIVANGGGTFNLTVRNGTGVNVAAPVRPYEVHIYFVSPCSTAPESPSAPPTSSANTLRGRRISVTIREESVLPPRKISAGDSHTRPANSDNRKTATSRTARRMERRFMERPLAGPSLPAIARATASRRWHCAARRN